MTNTAINNKRYGFGAEAELVEYLRNAGSFIGGAERLHLTGKEDEGDLVLHWESASSNMETIIVQLKTFAGRTAKGEERPLSRAGLKRWLRALRDQRGFYASHRGLSEAPEGILVVKFKGDSWDDALVIQRLGDWAGSVD